MNEGTATATSTDGRTSLSARAALLFARAKAQVAVCPPSTINQRATTPQFPFLFLDIPLCFDDWMIFFFICFCNTSSCNMPNTFVFTSARES